MSDLEDRIEAEIDTIEARIAKLRADNPDGLSVAQKKARKALQDARSRLILMKSQAAAADLSAQAAQVLRAALDAERRKVENVLAGLAHAVAGAVAAVREMLREFETEPAAVDTPVAEPHPPVMEAPEQNDPVILRRTTGGQMVYGHLVRKIQAALDDDGFDPNGIDMKFGAGTAKALADWHAATGSGGPSSVSASEWTELTDAPLPDMFDICAQVTAAFEGHGFAGARGDWDGAIATWGYHGYTLKYGHLQNVLRESEAASPGILAAAFGTDRAAALLQMLAMAIEEQRAWGKVNLLQPGGGMKPAWISGFRELGERRECRQVQLAYSRREFWERKALPQAARLGLIEALSLGTLFDTAIQQGGLNGTALGKIEAAIAADPGMSERDKRALIAEAAAASLETGRFSDDVRQRRNVFIDGRGRVHHGNYDLSFWGFAAAFDEDEGRLDDAGEAVLTAPVPAPAPVPAAAIAAAPGSFAAFFETHVKPHAGNFTADEFLFKGASNAPGGRCAGRNTDPPEALWPNCVELAKVLQAFRDRVGVPVRILSCYRSPAYNECVGGRPGSQHKQFRAADIVAPGAGNPRGWRDILRELRIARLFRGGIGTYGSFVHVDTRGTDADWTG